MTSSLHLSRINQRQGQSRQLPVDMVRPQLSPRPQGEGQGEGKESVICDFEGEWFKHTPFPLIPTFSLGEKESLSSDWFKFGVTVIFPICVYPCPSVVKTNSVA